MVFIVSVGQSIQDAVDLAAAGDTILVRRGTFNENLTITGKNGLRIVGAGPGETILDGTNLGGVGGIFIDGSHAVTIAGFEIRNFEGDGIEITGNQNVIRNNLLIGNGEDGVEVSGNNNLILDNTIKQNASDGVDIESGTGHYVIGNRLVGNENDGLRLESVVVDTLIMGNESRENLGDGFDISGDGHWIIENAAVDNADQGIDIEQGVDILVYGNTCKGNRIGMEVDASGLVAIRNVLNGNRQDGINASLNASDDSVSSGLVGSLLLSNEMSYNGADGFRGRPEVNTSFFVNNDVDENGGDGIDLHGGDTNVLIFNDIDDNEGSGIDVDNDSDGNVIDNNTIDDNESNGIRLTADAQGNALRVNRLRENTPFDILAQLAAATANVFDRNSCEQSSPPSICS